MPPVPFLTPSTTSVERQCRTLRTPTNKEWLGVFNSALYELTNPYNWQQVNPTDLTVDEAIALVEEVLTEFFLTAECTENGACLQPDGSRVLSLSLDGHIRQLDNGAWIAPTDDYTVPPVPAREEPTPYERRCLAAANAENVLKQTYEVAADAIAEGLDEAEIIAAMVAYLTAAIGLWLGLALAALAFALLALFRAFIEIAEFMTIDLWDEAFSDLLRCVLFNCADDTGDVVTFNFECVNMGMADAVDLSGIDALNQLRLFGQVSFILNIIGVDGLNAAGATTEITEAVCDDCADWCYTVDLATTNGGFTVTGQTYYSGTYNSGQGWAAANKVIGVQRTILQGQFPFAATAHIKRIDWTYNYTKGTNQNGVIAVGVARNNFTEILFARNMEHQLNGTGLSDFVETDVDATAIDFDIQCSHNAYGGSALLRSVTLQGSGTRPTFLEAMGWVDCS